MAEDMGDKVITKQAGETGKEKPSFWQKCVSLLTSTQDSIEAEELQENVRESGMTPVSACADRSAVTVRGTLRTVSLSPRAGVPTLEAELYDGSGSVTLVWLGRRRIPGVEPDRHIVATGRVSLQDGRRVLYNPRYELRPGSED